MWEITVVGEVRDYSRFLLFENMLKSNYDNDVIVAISLTKSSAKLSIAVKVKKLIHTIKRLVIELILKICKEEYFVENLQIDTDDKDMQYFIILTAVMSNLEDEIDYAMVKFKFAKMVYIRSLLRFRLSRLYFLWEKFAVYFNYNMSRGIGQEIYLNFLKFLASNSRNGKDIIYLEDIDNHMILKDKSKNVLVSIPKSDEISIVVNLIIFAPNKLIINCYGVLSDKIANLIKYLFDDRVSILI